jgi:hypothetical protein
MFMYACPTQMKFTGNDNKTLKIKIPQLNNGEEY